MPKAIAIHCRRGHLWAENTRVNKKGFRFCLACKKIADRAHVLRAKTKPPGKPFCPHGHPMSEGNIVWGNGWICLTCKQVRDREYSKTRTVTRDQLTRVFAALREGNTLSQCYGWKNQQYVGGKIVDVGAMTRFMTANPRIKKQIKQLAHVNRCAVMQASADRKRLVAAPALLKNNGADAFEAVTRATSGLWEGERGDIMSLMFVAMGEGRLHPRDAAKRLPEYVNCTARDLENTDAMAWRRSHSISRSTKTARQRWATRSRPAYGKSLQRCAERLSHSWAVYRTRPMGRPRSEG